MATIKLWTNVSASIHQMASIKVTKAANKINLLFETRAAT
jgi:hypothetical protein